MKYIFVSMGMAVLMATSCNQVEQKTAEKTAERTDTVINTPDTTTSPVLIPGIDTPPPEHYAPPEDTVPYIRTGKHSFTLHWISWERPGQVQITKDTSVWYTVTGKQEEKTTNAYITINGKLRRHEANSLLFRGKIEYVQSTINSGQPCIKEGEFIFKSTQNRKYWRLQHMLNCDGVTTDYVDIYF